MVANSQNILSSDTHKVAEKYRRCSMESYYSKRYYFILFRYCEKQIICSSYNLFFLKSRKAMQLRPFDYLKFEYLFGVNFHHL